MDVIKAQLLRIQEQLGGLSASQKMLTVSLVAIMIMTMIWWSRYAGTAEMEPVFDQSLPVATVGAMRTALDGAHIPNQVSGDRILVPSDQRSAALAALAVADALPGGDTSQSWDDMLKAMTPWDGQTKTAALQNHQREVLLASVLKRLPGVSSATVLVNPVKERRIGDSLEPTASVILSTRASNDNLPAKKLAGSAAGIVASAVSGLKRGNVTVTVDGQVQRVGDPNGTSLASSDLLEATALEEQRQREKIAIVLPDGSNIAVRVKLDNVMLTKTDETWGKIQQKERSIETTTEETSQPTPQSSEPGALPNTGLSIGQSAVASSATTNSEKNKTEMQNFADRSVSQTTNPGGGATVESVAIRVPRSYFVALFRARNPAAAGAPPAEPNDTAIQPLVDEKFKLFKEQTKNAAAMTSDERISLDLAYDDINTMLAMGATDTATAGIGGMLGGHVKEIGLAALALVSLFMVSGIVRKSTPAPIIAPSAPTRGAVPNLEPEETIAGVVGDSTTALDGMELDDSTLKSQQMVEQVSTMVKEDPEAAASLVKRWLNNT